VLQKQNRTDCRGQNHQNCLTVIQQIRDGTLHAEWPSTSYNHTHSHCVKQK